MRTYSLICGNLNEINEFVEQHHLTAEKHVLIQLFTCFADEQFIQNIRNIIIEQIPQAIIMNTPIDKVQKNEAVIANNVMITCTVFSDVSQISTILSLSEKDEMNPFLTLSNSIYKSLQDIEAFYEKKAEEKIACLAYFDAETGLPNRLHFTNQVEDFVQRFSKKKKYHKLAVLFIDLDRFKMINDTVGHYAGDIILKQLAKRIQGLLPKKSFLARFSGDKFTILITEDVEVEKIADLGQTLLHDIARPIMYEAREFFLTGSIGVSFYPNDGITTELLFKHADTAMNLAKQQGGNKMKFYSTEMNQQVLYRLELEGYLRKALEKNEFHICFQPLIDLSSGEVYGSEALIRWEHPKLGLVSPGEFIPLAEETGLIHEIGKWVLKEACQENKKWHDMGYDYLTISVNVSADQFQQISFIDVVKEVLEATGLPPQFLTLELTEGVMLRNISHSVIVMKELQKLGVKVSIDDFGTGYSSLSYLKDLPINTLKIDRSFINNLKVNTTDIAIVKAIITMGHGLAVKVVAEGVETDEQIELLKELQCHYAQGFYIDRPMKSEEFEKGLAKLKAL
ncbi:EAL domain-containing protein [Fredinandcohnia sp. QZ13]|uniref:putative bifunctional diguanylate cyclase/phosphodiesterase n=1 Tax=Fredinandcohnia sp. QZ13 TaxID=3073144 RepID=UPI0028536788|nr:EAL domain-containing protein [Fredinandcohnia sp. QZ13]MDR4887091.1 EAL domain-containing protein [Fredinandcohnia sp. QZ13]